VARRLIVCADDFGRDEAVNEAVERANQDGILTCASLMVGAPAAADAVRRARRLPGLRVGLHLVLVDGRPVLPPDRVPALVGRSGAFRDDMARAGLRYFLDPRARRQLAAEIGAQFAAFRATGLALDHVNAHKHFHVHPTIAGLVLAVGRDFGLGAMRVPAEPLAPLRRAAAAEGARVAPPLYAPWIALLRRRARRAGLAVNDHLLGLAWSGAMTEPRVLSLLAALPPGVSELYCHPAVAATPCTPAGYRPVEEFAALVSPAVRRLVAAAGIVLAAYGDLGTAPP
jgi:hopanoid biosynthesis associated protein HpnK